jgi:hypothetical protein
VSCAPPTYDAQSPSRQPSGPTKKPAAQHAHFRAVRCDCFGLGTDLFGFESSSTRVPRSGLNEHCNITKAELSLHAGAGSGINLPDLNPLSKKPPRGLSFSVIPPQLLASSGQAFPSRSGSMFELLGRRPLSSKDLNLLLAWGKTFGYAFAFSASPGLECSMALAAALLFCPWKREMRGFLY